MSGFEALPAEIRCIIYGHLFTGTKAVYHPPQQYVTRSSKTRKQKVIPRSRDLAAIFRVCRLTYAEARPCFLTHATTNLTHLMVADWSTKLRPECGSLALQVKHVVLDLYKTQEYCANQQLQRSLRLMKALEFLTFINPGYFRPNPGYIHVNYSGSAPGVRDSNGDLSHEIRTATVHKIRVLVSAGNIWFSPTLRQALRSRKDREFKFALRVQFGVAIQVLDQATEACTFSAKYDYAVLDYGTEILTLAKDESSIKKQQLSVPNLLHL
jgi:hypothetical protein